ncbi:hypothetical protein F5Y05DRAFT_398041 [Hypoxylon sp. FL0543]|nr:hypothetical protein F5Y05DRAFT_398041 [Hypoxylon sp. FL0543]
MITSTQLRDTAQCFGLVFLSIFFLPFSASVVCICYIVTSTIPSRKLSARRHAESRGTSCQRTVLVTGVGMAKGLALARSFYLSGHRVIGADIEGLGAPCSGRYSRSLAAFYRLPKPSASKDAGAYANALVDIVKAENVEIWVSCSGVASAIEDAHAKELIEQHTPCKCIQFDVRTTSLLHEKGSFMEECGKLGLPVPETHEVRSERDVLRLLSTSAASTPGRRFILKPVRMDDIHRGNMTLLPLPTKAETKQHVSKLPISDSNPWILQQFIPGREEYCTHALVIRGEVKCFAACPSTEMLMHYKPLPPSSPLWKAMLAFTTEFVRRSPRPETMTGHLSFDFMATEGIVNPNGFEKNIYAIECNPRAHTAVVLFAQRGREMDAMVDAYLSALDINPKETDKSFIGGMRLSEGTEGALITSSANTKPRYWMGHDLPSLFLQFALLWCRGLTNPSHFLFTIREFALHVFFWKEGTFEIWDPLPAFVLYHISWPMAILTAWWHGKRWSRINVSTMKMFSC